MMKLLSSQGGSHFHLWFTACVMFEWKALEDYSIQYTTSHVAPLATDSPGNKEENASQQNAHEVYLLLFHRLSMFWHHVFYDGRIRWLRWLMWSRESNLISSTVCMWCDCFRYQTISWRSTLDKHWHPVSHTGPVVLSMKLQNKTCGNNNNDIDINDDDVRLLIQRIYNIYALVSPQRPNRGNQFSSSSLSFCQRSQFSDFWWFELSSVSKIS